MGAAGVCISHMHCCALSLVRGIDACRSKLQRKRRGLSLGVHRLASVIRCGCHAANHAHSAVAIHDALRPMDICMPHLTLRVLSACGSLRMSPMHPQ
jgi:hypothetical protein